MKLAPPPTREDEMQALIRLLRNPPESSWAELMERAADALAQRLKEGKRLRELAYCSQCGFSVWTSACGPTHAMKWHELQATLVAETPHTGGLR